MQKVINNLLSNAVKHTKAEDTISINVSQEKDHVILLFVELEVDLFTARIFEEEQIILIQEVNQIVLAYFDLHVTLFLFTEIKKFRNQFP